MEDVHDRRRWKHRARSSKIELLETQPDFRSGAPLF